jgi:hypothetical protein
VVVLSSKFNSLNIEKEIEFYRFSFNEIDLVKHLWFIIGGLVIFITLTAILGSFELWELFTCLRFFELTLK